MSSVSIQATTSATFVYEGCYRARGELSFAEQAAWGLCSQAPTKHKAMRTRALATTPTFQVRHAHTQIRPQHNTRASRHLGVAHDRPRRVWRAHGKAHAFSRHALTVRWRRRAALSHSRRWRRYAVKVLGRAGTLLMGNGRSFMSAQPQGIFT